MNGSIFEVIVVGAGHAGLSTSYYLKHLGLEHVIFERGKIGETWRTQRWDNFRMITPDKLNVLPGSTAKLKDPDQFSSAASFRSSLLDYVNAYQLPVSENSNVLSIEKAPGSPIFKVKVSHDNEAVRTYDCWQVIIASGSFNEKFIPLDTSTLPATIRQVHSSEYRNITSLQDGAVLIVGGSQSGCDIAEELIDHGRIVFLSTSDTFHMPRSYRGKDIMDWLVLTKEMDAKDKLPQNLRKWLEPVVASTRDIAKDLSLKHLFDSGVVIFGALDRIDGSRLSFKPGLKTILQRAVAFELSLRGRIDHYIQEQQVEAPPDDLEQIPDSPSAEAPSELTMLDASIANITNIVWATGSVGNFGYINLPVFGANGEIEHKEGITAVDGLYFVGLPWQRTRKSGFIFGVKEEASFMASRAYSVLR